MKLVAEGLTLTRGGRPLVADLAFTVDAGEALVVTGRNGAGKTTLLRAVGGLYTPAGGSIRLESHSTARNIGEHCHYVGHLNAVKSGFTVAENVLFWSRYLGGPHTAMEPALTTLGLAALRDIPAGDLSAGQKRRLGLARLLVAERPVWLLDEPTTSLDAASQTILAEVINAHLARGGMLLAATHLPLGLTEPRRLHLGAPQ